MSAPALAPVAVATPIVVACLVLGFARVLPRRAVDGAATATATAVLGLDVALLTATVDGRVVTWTGGWTPASGVGITLVADGIGAGAALVAAALVVAALVYSWRYFDDAEAHFHALVLLFLAGMTGFALSGDLFDMFVFFELMGAVAYALTGFRIEEPQAVQGALAFGVINSLGAYITLFGIGLLYARTGALGLAPLAVALAGRPQDALVVAAAALVTTGFLVKGAIAPFHFWLDDAHAVAPTPICVLFSGIMVELGLYATARVGVVVFGPDLLRPALVALGAVTAVVGSVMCLAQRHLKRLLAYSTIGHAGLFVIALSSPDPAAVGALYVLGHAGTKAALFLMAGVILNRYGSVDEIDLHGRGREATLLPWLMLLAGLAIAGLPPLGPGLGKAVAEHALGDPWTIALFVLTSALTGGAVLRATLRIYFGFGPHAAEDDDTGPTTSGAEDAETDTLLQRVPLTMLIPIVVLLGTSVVLGMLPGLPAAVAAAAATFVDAPGYVAAALGEPAQAPPSVPEVGWTGQGALLGVVAAILACAVAMLAVWRRRLPEAWRRPPPWLAVPMTGLRALHSGHVGDYAAWLILGVAVLGACAALPLLV